MLAQIVFPEEEPFFEGVAGCGGLGTHEEQEFADFGLEDDDESDESHAHDLSEDAAGEPHAEAAGELPGDDDDDDGPEDAHHVGAADKAVGVEEKESDEQDVDDVDEANAGQAGNK